MPETPQKPPEMLQNYVNRTGNLLMAATLL